jgi:hypothetical protein
VPHVEAVVLSADVDAVSLSPVCAILQPTPYLHRVMLSRVWLVASYCMSIVESLQVEAEVLRCPLSNIFFSILMLLSGLCFCRSNTLNRSLPVARNYAMWYLEP